MREKHAIYLDSVLRFDHERPAVKVLDQHLLQLVIRVEQVCVHHIAAISSAAPIVERVVRHPDSFSELDHKVFKLFHELVVCLRPIHSEYSFRVEQLRPALCLTVGIKLRDCSSLDHFSSIQNTFLQILPLNLLEYAVDPAQDFRRFLEQWFQLPVGRRQAINHLLVRFRVKRDHSSKGF